MMPAKTGAAPDNVCPSFVLSRFERLSLAVEAGGMDERTVIAAYANPTSVRESTLVRLAKAAAKLGLPTPTLAQAGESFR